MQKLICCRAGGSFGDDESVKDFADVLIDPSSIEFPRDALGMLRVIGKGNFGQVSRIFATKKMHTL